MIPTTTARPLIACAFATALLLIGCQTPAAGPPDVKYADVNGARLPYVEDGKGAPVVFLHGGMSDYRTWDGPRAAMGKDFRTVAYTQRYFGTEPWGANWPKFSVQTHSDDLAAFIRGLNAGPVHLVAWSYGGHIALNVALTNPELVKSAFVYEPIVPSYVTDASELKAIGDDRGTFLPRLVQAVQAGNNEEAARGLIDVVGERAGYFGSMSLPARTWVLDSARTMPLLFSAPPPPLISCAQLAKIAAPVLVARGELSRPAHRVADGAARCLPPGSHLVVRNTNHMWPLEEPKAFSETVIAFIKGRGAR